MDCLTWLQSWYADQCDGDWEHEEGLKIYTVDNPGWRVQVGLLDTDLEGKLFEEVKVERSEKDWYRCWVKDRMFQGACGSRNLLEMLEVFRTWALR